MDNFYSIITKKKENLKEFILNIYMLTKIYQQCFDKVIKFN